MNPSDRDPPPNCHFLRWKGHDRAAGPGERSFAFARNQVPYTCLRTCQPFGPDDEPAAPECCDDARPCYEPASPPDPGPLRDA